MNDIPLERGGGVPKQSAPVNRYPLFGSPGLFRLILPHAGVELVYGAPEDLVRFRMYLVHGANYNDPPAWRFPSYETLKTSGRS
jgi:cyanobactin biosynthesis protein (PatB/AcyB/McaB family)